MEVQPLDHSQEAEEAYIKANYASKGERFGAAIIDNIITGVLGMILAAALAGVLPLAAGVFSSLLLPMYKIGMEANGGQTIGKKIGNVKVVRDDGNFSPIGWLEANKRFLLWWPLYLFIFVSNLIGEEQIAEQQMIAISLLFLMVVALILYMGTILSVFWNPRGKTWHDKVGGTICIKAT